MGGVGLTRNDLLGTTGLAAALERFGVAQSDVPDKEALVTILDDILQHPGLDVTPGLRSLAEQTQYTASHYEWNSLSGAIRLLAPNPVRALKIAAGSSSTPLPAVGRPKKKSEAPLRILPRFKSRNERRRLNQTQKNALDLVSAAAKPLAEAGAPKLRTRVLGLGYSSADLDRLITFVQRTAPITVNLHPERVVNDTPMIDGLEHQGRYRTQFETKVSGSPVASGGEAGGSRDNVEKRLFRGAYHEHELVPHERPIYGALNGELAAFGGAPGYGLSHLVLEPSVRARSTISHTDSLHLGPDEIGTFEHPHHVLLALPDNKLMAMLEIAIGRASRVQDHPEQMYFEVQVHGPVELDQDIQALVVEKRLAGTDVEATARRIANDNGVDLYWTNGVDLAVGDRVADLEDISVAEIKASLLEREKHAQATLDFRDVSRTLTLTGPAPYVSFLHPIKEADKPQGYTVLNRAGAGWYTANRKRHLVKLGPPRQLQAELFGSYLWRRCGLPATEVQRCLVKEHGAGVAIPEIPNAEEVSSSWNGRETNEAAITKLLVDHPEARPLMLRALLLDLVTSNMDGPQSLLRGLDGVCFIDFGGTIHSTPRGRAKEARHFDCDPHVAGFLAHLKGQIGESHPVFSATPEEMQREAQKLIDDGLFTFFEEAAVYADLTDDRLDETGPRWTKERILEQLRARATFLTNASAWESLETRV
jgi:hypothetical protein